MSTNASQENANIKNIQITGVAASQLGFAEMGALPGGSGTRKRGGGGRSRSNKTLRVGTIEKEGGTDSSQTGAGTTSTGTFVQLAANKVPGSSLNPDPVGKTATLLATHAAPFDQVKKGGAESPSHKAHVKVVLAPKVKKGGEKKVVLAAPASAAVAAKLSGGGSSSGGKTRKARKIKVSMRGLSKKIHRARTIRQKASSTTVEQIKKELHKAGLIKADSKAPDEIIRQMYADYMTLKSKAL